MTIRRFQGFVLAVVLSVGVTPRARAAEAGPAEADRHFSAGVELMKADNCPEAVPEFLASQDLDPSAATLVNLATCYARMRRTATAWKTYRAAASLAASEKNEALRERAVHAMSVLGPTLTKLQIVQASTIPLSIRINREELVDYDGLPVPLDPGENVVEAASPGHEPWRRRVNADELGATIVIEVPDLRPLPAPATAARPPEARPPARPEAPQAPGFDRRVPALVLGGAGFASIVVGAAFAISANRTYDESQTYCRANACTQPGVDLRDEAYGKAAVSTVTVGVGLAAVTAGLVLWLTNPSPQPHSARATAAPLLIDRRGFQLQFQ